MDPQHARAKARNDAPGLRLAEGWEREEAAKKRKEEDRCALYIAAYLDTLAREGVSLKGRTFSFGADEGCAIADPDVRIMERTLPNHVACTLLAHTWTETLDKYEQRRLDIPLVYHSVKATCGQRSWWPW